MHTHHQLEATQTQPVDVNGGLRLREPSTGPHHAPPVAPTAPSPAIEPPPCPIGVSRRRIPLLALPSPHLVPSRSELAILPPPLLGLCRAALARPGSRHSRAIAALASRIPTAPRGVASRSAYQVSTSQPADLQTHDEFFRIRRCDVAPAEAFLLGLFRALQVLRSDIEETRTTVPDARLALLSGALEATLAAALGTDVVAPLRWTRQHDQAPPDSSGLRWIRGHQIFAALSQGMIFALTEMESADHAGDAKAVGDAAGLMADLLGASAVSLELTGDFSEAYYRDVVRVGMESPFLPRGFSGLLSGDHRHLVTQMKMLRPVIERLEARQPGRHARIVENLGAVYASHKHVCARFVGAEQSSLLMARPTGRSAVEQIDKFRAMRLRSWATAAEPERTPAKAETRE